MNFDDYSKEFTYRAIEKGLSEDEIREYLLYAENLNEKSIPIIYDQKHLLGLLGIDNIYMYAITNSSDRFYRKFKIKKKNGKYRNIEEPLPILKEIQYWILKNILENCKCSEYSKAFKKNSSIKDNAKFHKKQNYIINLDIKNYFESIKIDSVYNLFLNLGYSKDVCVMLSKLCTNKGYLPQGAPTSPLLSNLITIELDNQLAKLSRDSRYKLRYSRYADDITFSGSNYINKYKFIKQVGNIIKLYGFTINDNKTRIITANKAQMVTGIVVNEKLQVSKKQRKQDRQCMYYIKKYTISEHLSKINWKSGEEKYIRHILGNVNFALFINPKDKDYIEYKKYLMQLLKKY